METGKMTHYTSYYWAEIRTPTMSSCSVRCTPNFFSPIVRSLTQMPPSPFTSRTWNSTLNLCSCSGPPHMSHGCADWPWSECQSSATGWRVSGLDGEVEEVSSACLLPPPGSTPGCVSADRHWQDTLSKGGINEPCWCIMSVWHHSAQKLRNSLTPYVTRQCQSVES